ncbi:hypothetical protein D3C87_2027860 [compost metagenome]
MKTQPAASTRRCLRMTLEKVDDVIIGCQEIAVGVENLFRNLAKSFCSHSFHPAIGFLTFMFSSFRNLLSHPRYGG